MIKFACPPKQRRRTTTDVGVAVKGSGGAVISVCHFLSLQLVGNGLCAADSVVSKVRHTRVEEEMAAGLEHEGPRGVRFFFLCQ